MTKTGTFLIFSAILFVGILFGASCSTKSTSANPVLAPHRTSVYFVLDRSNGFVAYVPEGSVHVGIKIQPNVSEPYVEVPKQLKGYFGMGDGEFIAWGYGGTLYIKDLEQLKNLIFVKK